MVRLNILLLLYAGFLYHIKSVYSVLLDLNNLSHSGLQVVKTVERDISKTMIYSTQERKITGICKGSKLIWMGYRGEYVRCVTRILSKWCNSTLIIIQINNAVKDDTYYIHIDPSNYVYISKEEFDEVLDVISKFSQWMYEKYSKRPKKPEKRKGDTDDTEKTKKRSTVEPQPQSDQPEPEVTQVKSIEDVEREKKRKDLMMSLRNKIQQRIQEKSKQIQISKPKKPLVPETILVELESDEHPKDSDISDVGLKFPPTELEQQQPPENQQLEPEVTQVEMGSDDDDSDLLNESLFGEDVEKWLESELEDIGLSESERDSLFEDTTEESD
ncbi:TpHN family protein [Theileria parva strain Muguga]|uniref:Tash1 protein, putative n=1 Tax=Theileria parva TaxID=5875 RepID=Q4N859_THEPA|nr:uncharacterized protein TpMuguga_01g00611 [Theileria parva strain Muguga]EAN33849.1 TpHN family protein [Theileria parva strain Muguga]|eukprot:XP_766132.1 hypothetical protein [Theileria parva strain Muguga]